MNMIACHNGTPGPKRQASLLSIVTPAFNESANLPHLYERLRSVLEPLGVLWEWVVIDDHSSDITFATVAGLARNDSRVRGYRLAKNFGSHTAIVCGLKQAQGDCAVVMAADLQDPPETLPQLLQEWQAGAQVVWAVRATRPGGTLNSRLFGRLYYGLMRHGVGIKHMPATGADFFLMDRCVIDTLTRFREKNASILALVTWMGFRQTAITYTKENRLHGHSGWTLRKKFKLVLDSLICFSSFPIRVMSYLGVLIALCGSVYTGVVIANAIAGRTPPGWASLMAVVVVLGGLQLSMMGVLGEYLWRALEESRRRPPYWLEASTVYPPANGSAKNGLAASERATVPS
jgi:dolichol-phosphate mannosyltransferase